MFMNNLLRGSAGTAAVLALLAFAGRTHATPVDVSVGKPVDDLVFRDALEVAHTPQLEKRLSADFCMDKTWDHEVLFAGAWAESGADEVAAVALSVTCVECYTKGTVTATLTDEDIVDPAVRLDFSGVEAYVDLAVSMSAGATYAVTLYATDSPIGLGFPGLSVGVVFYLDLVFSLSEELDMEGGFYVSLADGSYLEASVFGGDITKSLFDGLSSKSLGVTVKSGSATFKADLRLRVQCGAEASLDVFGIGAGAELGIYANLIEFVAELDSTPTCDLQSIEYFDLNVGAFANLDVVVDYKTIGAIPTISTTLLLAPTMTQCWIPAGSGAVSGGESATLSVALPPAGGIIQTTVSPAAPLITPAPAASGSDSPSFANASASVVSGDDGSVTSTLFTTTTFTITSCAASVVNCPASYASEIVVTQTVDVTTTVCPVAEASASATATSSAAAVSSAAPAATTTTTVITDAIVLVPCTSAIVATFTPPASTAAASNTAAATAGPSVAPTVHDAYEVTTVAKPATSSGAAAATTPTTSPFVGGGSSPNAAPWNGTATSTPPYLSSSAMAHGATSTPLPGFATAGAAKGHVHGALAALLVVLVAFVQM